jgi:crotonobetainyl-CoA:carnitine CoA-transferase CaiB-like acyl-CoA transferase
VTGVAEQQDGPLAGVRVADFSRVLAGPYATMLLGDLGADVVKVERPGVGDDTRAWGPPYDPEGRATYFESVNRNKRSVAIDLGSAEGRTAARLLALSADVLVENFVPGTMERFGLGFAELAAEHPGLVWCSVTGFGDAQAARGLPGYDLLVQAAGGLMSVTGPEPGHPTKVGVALVDVITGLHVTIGVLAALRHRERTGQGQRVDATLLSSLLSALVNQAGAYVGAGVVPGILGNAHPSIAPYEVFDTADRPMVVAVGNDGQFRSLATALGVAELGSDPRFATNPARVLHRHELNGVLAPILKLRDCDTWWGLLTPAAVPCGPVNDIAEAFALASRVGLDPVVDVTGGTRLTPSRQVAHPLRWSATPATYRLPPPALGEHTDEVLDGLGDGAARS